MNFKKVCCSGTNIIQWTKLPNYMLINYLISQDMDYGCTVTEYVLRALPQYLKFSAETGCQF